MTTQMLGELLAPAAAPRRAGQLLAAATPGQEGDGTDWRKGGLVWAEAAPGWELFRLCDPAEVDHGLKTEVLPYGGIPFVIRTLTQAPHTSHLEVLSQRAERQIRAATAPAIARELWTGELSAAEPWTTPANAPYLLANPRPGAGTSRGGPWLNPYLAAGELLDAETHPAAAVGAVEAAVADRLVGGPVYIHVPAEWVLELHQFGIVPDGDVLRTPLGSVVVADAGYPGTDGSSTAPCCYGTGPVQVWLDEPTVYDDPSLVVDTRNNRLGVFAERPALALFDPQTLVGCALAETP